MVQILACAALVRWPLELPPLNLVEFSTVKTATKPEQRRKATLIPFPFGATHKYVWGSNF